MDASGSASMPVHFIVLRESVTDPAIRVPFELEADVPDGAAVDAGPLGAQDVGNHGFEEDLAASRAGGNGHVFVETGAYVCHIEVAADADGD